MFDVGAAFRDISKGNEDALRFCVDFYFWVHAKDDVVDKEGSVTTIVQHELAFLQTVATNAFYQANHTTLFPVLQASLLSFIASEKLKSSQNVVDRITAQVLKSEYMNVFFAVAGIVDGFTHAAQMNDKYRIYSFDVEPVKNTLATTP